MQMLKKAAVFLLVLIGLKRLQEETEEPISIDEAFSKGKYEHKQIVVDDFRCPGENLYGVISGAVNAANILMIKITNYYFGNIEWAFVEGKQRQSPISDSEMSLFVDPALFDIYFNKTEQSLVFCLKDPRIHNPLNPLSWGMKKITILLAD